MVTTPAPVVALRVHRGNHSTPQRMTGQTSGPGSRRSLVRGDSLWRRRFPGPIAGDYWTVGAGAGIRTRTSLRTVDFKSPASTIPPLRHTGQILACDRSLGCPFRHASRLTLRRHGGRSERNNFSLRSALGGEQRAIGRRETREEAHVLGVGHFRVAQGTECVDVPPGRR